LPVPHQAGYFVSGFINDKIKLKLPRIMRTGTSFACDGCT